MQVYGAQCNVFTMPWLSVKLENLWYHKYFFDLNTEIETDRHDGKYKTFCGDKQSTFINTE